MWPFVDDAMQEFFQMTQPDAVVCVHPLFNHLSMWALRGLDMRVPFVTVVTDLVTTHPGWICPSVDRCLVPTELSRQYVIEGGLEPEKVLTTGLPISLKFLNNTVTKAQAQARLGLQPDLPIVLLVGGGEGMGPVYRISRSIALRQPRGQLVIVAGRNDRLRRRLSAGGVGNPNQVLGFVTYMPELMTRCRPDCDQGGAFDD